MTRRSPPRQGAALVTRPRRRSTRPPVARGCDPSPPTSTCATTRRDPARFPAPSPGEPAIIAGTPAGRPHRRRLSRRRLLAHCHAAKSTPLRRPQVDHRLIGPTKSPRCDARRAKFAGHDGQLRWQADGSSPNDRIRHLRGAASAPRDDDPGRASEGGVTHPPRVRCVAKDSA